MRPSLFFFFFKVEQNNDDLIEAHSSKDHVNQTILETQSDSSDGENETVPVPDSRKFSSTKYEKQYSWLYYSAAKAAYCCKMCDIFSPVLTNGQLNPWVEEVKLGTHPSQKLLKHSNSKPHINSIQKQSKVNAYDDKQPLLHVLLKQK